jgi:hypothetical protein
MTAAITPIAPLDRTAPTFKADLEAMFATYFPNLTVELTAFLSALTTLAGGGGFSAPYKFSTSTAVGDPGAGFLRLNNANALAATSLLLSTLGSDTKNYGPMLDNMGASSSSVLGQIRLVKVTDPTKFALYNLTQVLTPSGYRQLTLASMSLDSAPFVDNDIVLLQFTRTGDRGSIGPAGTIVRRTTSVVSNTAPAPDISTTDLYAITALAGAAVVGAPTNSGAAAADGQGLMFRIKDDGVAARALSWNAIYRAGSDVILPTTTVLGKVLYVGFIYNAAAAKWDLVSTLGNI